MIQSVRRRSHGASRLLLAVLLTASMVVLVPGTALAATGSVQFLLTSSATTPFFETGTHIVKVELTGLDGLLVGPLTVDIEDALTGTATEGAGGDYTFTSPTQVVFPGGSTNGDTQDVSIPLIDDDIDEGVSEDIDLVLGMISSGTDSIMAGTNTSHQVNISDDDDVGVTVAPTAVSVTEGGTTDNYTVSLDSRPSAAVTITPLSTTGDVSFSPTFVTIQPDDWDNPGGETFTVTAIDDDDVEDPHPDDTITHTVTGGDYDALSISNVSASITDNDSFEISIADLSASETDASPNFLFTVSIAPQSPTDIDVEYSTSVGGGNPASSGEFASITNQTFTIPANTSSVDITVGTTGDDIDEDDETFVVTLTNPETGVLVDDTAIGTIQDDDDSPVANPDAYGLNRGETLVVSASAGVIQSLGGSDSDGDTALPGLTASLVTGPANHDGVFTLNGDGSFTYDHDGSLTALDSFTYLLTDSGGNSSGPGATTVTLNITNTNSVPVLVPGVDVNGNEGSEIGISATFIDPDADIHVAQIDWGDGNIGAGVVDEGLKTITASHAYADDDEYTVTITLSDGLDQDVDTQTVTVFNVAPTHSVDGVTNEVDEGSEITFTTTPVDPGDEVFTYTWDVLRNGQVFTTWVDPQNDPTSTFSFTPDDDGVNGNNISWWVRVRVDDGDGASPRRARLVTVNNVDPTVEMKADGVAISEVADLGDEGTAVTFSLDVTDESGDSDTFTYDWEVLRLGQTVASGNGDTLQFTPQDNGTYIVTVDVDDDDNPNDPTTGTEAVFATFDNVAPTFHELRSNLSPPVNGNGFFKAWVSDLGGDDTHTLSVTWGDGAQTETSAASPIQLNHMYTAAGVVDAEVCLTDDDGGSVCEDLAVNVGGVVSLRSDFDGDGLDDAAVGIPYEANGGGVGVFYSDGIGPSRTVNDLFIQGVGGMPDADESGDEFGYDVAFGDFDGDGFDDLVVGHPGETVSNAAKAGAITVIPGSANGLDATNAERFHENTAGVPGSVAAKDRFGHSVATGDFNGDAFADVAIGSPGQKIGGKAATGKTTILYGSPSGLTTDRAQEVHFSTPGVAGVVVSTDKLGTRLASGDFNGDGESDLAISAPNKNITGMPKAGAVLVVKGSALGIVGIGSKLWSQSIGAFADTVEVGDRFGLHIAAADFNGDGRDDLAIGAPDESVFASSKAGAVWVLKGSGTMPTTSGIKKFTEGTNGVAGFISPNDRFASALAGADMDGDGFAELAIGIPFDDIGGKTNAGVVIVLNGTPAGLSGVGSERWWEDAVGVGGVGVVGDRFGNSLGVLDADANGRWDLLVGIPFQNTNTVVDSGGVLYLRGATSGLTNSGDRVIHQNVTGVLDDPDEGDKFGFGL